MDMLKKTMMVLSLALGLAACHPDEGAMTGDAGAKGGHGGSAAGGHGGGATGGSGGAATSGPAAFLGTWMYPAGTGKTTISCDDGTTFDAVTDGTERETFTAGTQPDEVIATDGFGCAVTCAVDGNTATCVATASCDGAMLTNDVYVLVDGELHETALGTIDLGDGTHCLFTSPQNILVRLP